jgi:hypothetical protein
MRIVVVHRSARCKKWQRSQFLAGNKSGLEAIETFLIAETKKLFLPISHHDDHLASDSTKVALIAMTNFAYESSIVFSDCNLVDNFVHLVEDVVDQITEVTK